MVYCRVQHLGLRYSPAVGAAAEVFELEIYYR